MRSCMVLGPTHGFSRTWMRAVQVEETNDARLRRTVQADRARLELEASIAQAAVRQLRTL